MGKETLRELGAVVYEQVKKNASIDWIIKESARAKLRVVVKRTLRKYGYPPDMQELATETVIKQAEMIADELAELNLTIRASSHLLCFLDFFVFSSKG